MTMIPARNQCREHLYGLYGGGYGGINYSESVGLMNRLEGCDGTSEACVGSDLVVGPMAEDESRTESVNEAGSSSKDVQDERYEGWLQLSVGTSRRAGHDSGNKFDDVNIRPGRLIELDLLPGGGGGSGSSSGSGTVSQEVRSLGPIFQQVVPEFRAPTPVTNITSAAGYTTTTLFLQHPGGPSSIFPHHQDINWTFRPMIPRNVTAAPASSSSFSSSTFSPLMPPPASYLARPLQLHAGIDVAGPSLDFRVIDPPRRPHTGIWFMLQASQNQVKEPFLPQIPKSYLRIKDGTMTVRLLMKYLVNKLKLDSESEIEITCKGQQLLPILTLQHVRDSIWSPRDAVTLLPDSSTTDHVMVLHYGRSA